MAGDGFLWFFEMVGKGERVLIFDLFLPDSHFARFDNDEIALAIVLCKFPYSFNKETVQLFCIHLIWETSDNNPTVTSEWKVEEITKTEIAGDKNRLVLLRELKDSVVFGSAKSVIPNVQRHIARFFKNLAGRTGHVFIDYKLRHQPTARISSFDMVFAA